MTERRQKHDRPALDADSLERLAIGYVGRYATSRHKLETYLRRKLVERGWAGDAPADPGAIAARFVTLGYVDDAGLAEARGRALGRRGYGARRLGQALDALGISGSDRAGALDAATTGAWETALRYAERRRFGPYARAPLDEAGRRRAFAAMLRAGHGFEHARKIIAALPGVVPQRDD